MIIIHINNLMGFSKLQDIKEEMIVERIEKLKEKKNAIIFAHNFSMAPMGLIVI